MTDAAILAVLERIEGHLAKLAADRIRPAPITDRAAMAELLNAVYQVWPGRNMTARELLNHAALPTEWRLRAAISGIVGGGDPGRVLGRALRRYADVEVGGLCVLRIGKDGGVAIWQVAAVKRVSG